MTPELVLFWVLVTVMVVAALVLMRTRSLRVSIVASVALVGALIVGLVAVSSWTF